MNGRMSSNQSGQIAGEGSLRRWLGAAAPLLEISPYPLAFLDLSGTVAHVTPHFPHAAEDSARIVGRPLSEWILDEERAALEEFLARIRDAAEPTANGALHPDTARLEAAPAGLDDPAFFDAHAPALGGPLLRLYPMRAGGAVVGVLVVVLRADSPIALGPGLADRERRQRERLSAVLEASREISSSLERDVILQNIVTRVREVIGVPEAVLFLMREDRQMLTPVVAGVDEFYDEVMALRLTPGEGIVGWVARTGRAEIVNHAEHDPRSKQVPGTPVEPTSLLCAPLIIKDQVVGVLALSRFGDEGFEPSDLELATILAAHCSVAIENARLYEEQRHTLSELKSTQDQLVQSAKLNALGEMAGGVAHDFNNILTAILGRTQLLLRSTTDPEARRALAVIEQTALDGAHTVRRIQEFTRVRLDEAAESVDVNEVMEQVADLTRPYWHAEAKSRDVHIALRTELNAGRAVLGSAAELREVFTNLVLNAVDAMPEGGTILLATEDRDGHVLVRVKDDGTGMDDATRARIFDPFFTTKPKKGTGLGLSVAYGILRRHHVEITVESAPGAGTTFRLLFPASESMPYVPPAPADAPELPRFTTLCIDDEAAVLDVVADLLEELGQTVERAVGGQLGIERALATRPEILFTDLGMPDVNGWQVARTVKDAAPETLVCMVTGWGMQLDPEPTRALGVDFILPKPFTVDDIRRVLADAAERKRTPKAA